MLKKNKIMIHYDNIVDFIINRSGTGMCPMEDATKDIDNPNDALVEIKKTLKKLQK